MEILQEQASIPEVKLMFRVDILKVLGNNTATNWKMGQFRCVRNRDLVRNRVGRLHQPTRFYIRLDSG